MYESNGLMSVESPEIAKYSPFERIFNGQITAFIRCAQLELFLGGFSVFFEIDENQRFNGTLESW